jgi:FemAB-related protein (PEP-CTERM system-associated)
MLSEAIKITVVTESRGKSYLKTQEKNAICDDQSIRFPNWSLFAAQQSPSLSRNLGWLTIFSEAFRHVPYCIEASIANQTVGILPLCFVKSFLFGRFLVSLPYLNTGGVLAGNEEIARAIIDRAVELADELKVRYLELRHEAPIEHAALAHTLTSKVHMRLALPKTSEELWKSFDPKVRNQIRKGEKSDLTVQWGGQECLPDFYAVFARNMRDLGTPVFSRKLFQSILTQFDGRAELCVVRHQNQPIAGGLLLHGDGLTEVPSASSLRSHNSTNANMLMYWHFLQRAMERGQHTFDFGRSSRDSNTYRFKKQWGALPEPAVWQYYVREGTVGDMRLESGKYNHMIRIWQRLPVFLTRWIGPTIVRGIP